MRRQLPPGNVPMFRETHRRLALQLRMAAEELIEAPSVDAYNKLSKMLAALAGAGMQCVELDAASATLTGICDRFERAGKVGASEQEAATLRQQIAYLDQRLPLIPINKFARAVAQVELYCATVGA